VRFIEVLVETLLSPVGVRRADELVLVVEALFQSLVAGLRFEDAARLLRRLRDSIPSSALPQLRDALARMAGPARLSPLQEAIATSEKPPEEAEALLLLLAPAVVPTALDFLLAAPRDEAREFYAGVLVKIGRPALDPIVARLGSAEDASRIALVRTLGRLHDPGAVEALASELRRAAPAVRREIVRALGAIPGTESTGLLLQVGLEDEDVGCRILALRCLGQKADQLGQDQLLGRIQARDSGIGKEERDLLFVALGRVGDDRVLPFLERLLKPSWIPGRWNRDDARRAAGALARMRGPKARALLDEFAQSRRGDVAEICTLAILDAGRGQR
jgi:hypothetical protein